MSCSLKEVKDGLVNLKIVSSYMEIKSMDKVLRFENSYIDAYTKKHGSLVELGSMFVFEDLRGKTKLAFNKPFFEKMDQLENAVFFKKNALREGFSKEEVVSELEIKEGVDFIFESNPELANIGSQEEYSAYLDTVAGFDSSQTIAPGSEQDINGFKDYIESISSDESIASQEQDAIMQEVYAQIDSMLESNEITVTCKI
jgi:hypothetical protein